MLNDLAHCKEQEKIRQKNTNCKSRDTCCFD